MTLAETFDLLDVAPSRRAAVGDRDRFDSLEIFIGDTAPEEEEERDEPTLAAAPFFIEFDEPARLDPERAGLLWEVPAAPSRTLRWRSPLVSLAVHLLPLLTIIAWPSSTDIARPIPVQLVFEEPPPPQPAPQSQPPQQQPKMEAGRLASVDMGAVKPNEEGLSTKPIPAFGDPQPKPLDNAADSATPSTRAPPLPSPKPAPPKQHVAAVQPPPKPSGSPTAHREETPQDAPRAARYAGSAASRDEYLAYLVTLTRQHMDLLPMSVIGSRHGETVISVVVYENGTIGPLSVVRSSGYPDIDQRIEQMVAAVRRFPPLPQWYQSNTVELELTMHWPEALEHPQ